MRNTFSTQFYARPSKVNKKGLAPIELSIICNGERVLINLPYKVNPEEFNRKRRPKEIEDYLNVQRSLISKVMTDIAENNIPLTSSNLRTYYRTGGVKSYTVEDLFNDFLDIQRERVGHSLTKGVYRKYELVKELFFTTFDCTQEATAITNAVVRKFFVLLDSKYDSSTACGYKTKFKAFVTFGLDNNKLKINPFQGVKITKERKEISYLTDKEIDLLINTPIENESLSRVRDCAVFQLASGLSFADVCALTPEDLHEEDGTYYIAKNRVKTGTPFFSVVLPFGVEVYKRYDGHIVFGYKCFGVRHFSNDIDIRVVQFGQPFGHVATCEMVDEIGYFFHRLGQHLVDEPAYAFLIGHPVHGADVVEFRLAFNL